MGVLRKMINWGIRERLLKRNDARDDCRERRASGRAMDTSRLATRESRKQIGGETHRSRMSIEASHRGCLRVSPQIRAKLTCQ
jgi:hypothetical protein